MTCLPCVKEILNNGAKASQESLHSAAQKVPTFVKEGRLSIDEAEAFYERAIEIDEWYCDEIAKVLKELYRQVEPPWHGMNPEPK